MLEEKELITLYKENKAYKDEIKEQAKARENEKH